ncbi:hypothetical protein L1280_000783 [Deinococcus sp. HSC-46F16]|uniref:hypothetical protein n=1 Tax=Deinococcus sp. HSC-46F16 TaxID=2910968 RepID=UPI00209E21FF|nr:hypothetical protein [Deinococcus sp. HSC-46F16]MCP2013655.1 hypothetical protein [Deinococcus sp. HSC-46F16]
MGEAKRRKELGLMPTTFPVEVRVTAGGEVTLMGGPDDPAVRERLLEGLRSALPGGATWEQGYRQLYLMMGRGEGPVATPEDFAAIPVPPQRRLTGDLVLGARSTPEDVLLLGEGASLRVRTSETSHDGETWEPLSLPDDGVEQLLSHPLARERGPLLGTLTAEHWREGRIDLDAEPPEALLEPLEDLVREWDGEGEEWRERHLELLDGGANGDAVPQAIRTRLELRGLPLLPSSANQPHAVIGEGEETLAVYLSPLAYTLDGEDWLPYGGAEGEATESSNFGDLLTQMLDVQTVPVTVWVDGRVEWAEGDVPEEQAERVRGDLRSATGAGDSAAWAEWTRTLLAETFADEAPGLAERGSLPAVQGVRLDLPTDSLTDPDDPAQYFIESEVTFDGQTWRDLYAEELPEELREGGAGGAAN